ncbi:MAG: SH3 domain-containing protein [Lachnospiraceae bacterium]|nr:SH3 domain-containing protein [Lachnospiraceae bacterium]
MKKKFAVVLFLTLSVSILAVAGCGKKESKEDEEATEVVAEEVTEIPTEEIEVPIPEEPAEEVEYDFGQVGPDTVSDSLLTEDFTADALESVSQSAAVSETAGTDTDMSASGTASDTGTGTGDVAAMNDTKLYATESVRIRREPNTDSEIAGKLATGDEVTANGKAGDWYRITRNGETLYVKAEYLTETKPEKKEETDGQTTDQTAENSTNTDTAAAATDPLAAAAANAAAAATAATDASTTENTASSSSSSAASESTAATDTAAADAAAQAAAAQAAAAAAATASAGATYDLNGLKVNATEYKALLDTWRWATANGTDEEAKEYVLHHPAGDLEAVLKSKGLR